MYYYIVDPQKISPRQFERVQNILYSSVSEYRISGEIARVTGLRTINQLVEGALQRGVKTLVAVGSDETLHEVINAIKGRDILVGFIPLLATELSQILGLDNIEQAAKTIGLRRITELDLVQVNNFYFLSRLTFGAGIRPSSFFDFKTIQNLFKLPAFQIQFSAQNQEFRASLTAVGGIIVNQMTQGMLKIMLLPKLNNLMTFRYRRQILTGDYENIPGSSTVYVKQLEINSPAGLPLRVGDRIITRTPAQISVIPQALKIIVGRDRKF